MKRCLTLIAVSGAMMMASCHKAEKMATDDNGHLYDNGGIAVIDLHGSWYAMGRQYGLLAKGRMDDVLCYLDRKIGPEPEKMASATDIADRLYSKYPKHLKDFFDGVVATSGLSLDKVKMCNAVEYVEGVFMCSAMAVWSDFADGKLVFGRNYDAVNYSDIDRDVVVTVYHPAEGNAVATVGYAGELYCVNGFSSSGLFVELNNGMPSAGADIDWSLCPSTTTLFDMLFSARNLDDVDAFFRNTASFASFIIGVADKDQARSYEWCSEGVRRGDVTTEPGLMISTNHYVNDGWTFTVPSDADSWNSITRRRNLAEMAMQNKGHIDADKMMEIMSTPIENGGPKHNLTRYQIVAVPEDMTLYIYVPCNGKWTKVSLGEYFER